MQPKFDKKTDHRKVVCLPNWRRHPDLNRGIRVLQTHALPLGYVAIYDNRSNMELAPVILCGAGDGARTRYLHLGKVALYQMSYARMDAQPPT